MKTVLAFGTFDLLHEGHRRFLHSAASLGNYLVVVVTRRRSVIAQKGRSPAQSDIDRLCSVLSVPHVNEAHLGDKNPGEYQILKTFPFSVLAVGYDQWPEDARIKEILAGMGKSDVAVKRLEAFEPEKYKTSVMRATIQQ